MDYDQFIAEVRDLAGLDGRDEAERATRATLATLEERLAGNEPSNLAAQLPCGLKSSLEGTGGQESFSLDEFYERVARKEGVGKKEAAAHARAVAATVRSAVTGGEMDDVRVQLGPGFAELFGQPGASA